MSDFPLFLLQIRPFPFQAFLFLKDSTETFVSLKLFPAAFFAPPLLFHLFAFALNRLDPFLITRRSFLIAHNLCGGIFLLRPQGQKLAHPKTVKRRFLFPIEACNQRQLFQLFLLTPRKFLMPLIIPDILLHRRNVRAFRNVADVFRDELLNIDNRLKGNRLFQHSENLFPVDVPFCEQIFPVFLMRGVQFAHTSRQIPDVNAQTADVHGNLIDREAMLRNGAVIKEKRVLPTAVGVAVKDNPGDKTAVFDVVVIFASDITAEIPSAPGVRIVPVHIRPEIAVQSALRIFVGGLIEVSRVRLPKQYDLQRVNYGGFPCPGFSGQKIHVVQFNDLFREIQPVHQQNLFQPFH